MFVAAPTPHAGANCSSTQPAARGGCSRPCSPCRGPPWPSRAAGTGHDRCWAGAAPPQPAAGRLRQCSAAVGSSSATASSLDGEAWEATYGQSTLRYGISLEQGVRETMEDAAQVVQHGRCGFFFASERRTQGRPGERCARMAPLLGKLSPLASAVPDKLTRDAS